MNLAEGLPDVLRRVERVGQDATRRLAETTFRHLHDLSLRFHLEPRPGAVTKIVERGTKSIDMMLYFLLFNIAPTVLQLTIVLAMFWIKFGFGLVAATAIMVAVYIRYTRLVTDWRTKLRVTMNDLDTGAVARAVDVSHTAPKNHFGSLEGLLSELAAVGYRRLGETLAAAMLKDGQQTPMLKFLGRAFVSHAREFTTTGLERTLLF